MYVTDEVAQNAIDPTIIYGECVAVRYCTRYRFYTEGRSPKFDCLLQSHVFYLTPALERGASKQVRLINVEGLVLVARFRYR